jgi:hypothetical protein
VESFQQFLDHGGRQQQFVEFSPHHLVFSTAARRPPLKSHIDQDMTADVQSIQQMIGQIFTSRSVSRQSRRAIAVGLLNTHFAALEKKGGAKTASYEDFLFLLYVALSLCINLKTIPLPARKLCRLALEKNRYGRLRSLQNVNHSVVSSRILSSSVRL